MRKSARSDDCVEDAVVEPGLDAHRDALERRLADGYLRIDEAALAGADITEWESFWLRLLREYEDVCRELDPAA
jgi:hypothetical protein